MRVAIAIPTFNRANELYHTLHSLADVAPAPNTEHEVLVVDNNSTDETAAVVAEMQVRLPCSVRRVVETNQGLCHARNRAIAESDAEIVAFLDDDVDVDSKWLAALCNAFRQRNAAVVGGRADLIYPGRRPHWLTEADERFLSKVDLGQGPRLTVPGALFGLNLAIRRNWLENVGPFRTDLDRIGNCLLSGGETELLSRILLAGGELWYEPEAVVGHRVAPERLHRSWFVKRHYWGARTQIRLSRRSRWQSLVASMLVAPKVPKVAAGAMYRALRHGADSAAAHDRQLWLAFARAELVENLRTAFLGPAGAS